MARIGSCRSSTVTLKTKPMICVVPIEMK